MSNLVGLGGCESSGTLPISAVSLAFSLIFLILDWISPNLPDFCGTKVLQSPTVWLGIFTGGYVTHSSERRIWRSHTFALQHFNCVDDDVPYQGFDPYRHFCHIHHFVAPIDCRDILS